MLNYLKETLAFQAANAAAPVSPRAQVLWHYLLYFNNAAALKDSDGTWYWPVWFTADNQVLVKVLGIKESRKLYHYRKSLIDRGWVRFDTGLTAGQLTGDGRATRPGACAGAGAYALVPFTKGVAPCHLGPPGRTDGPLVWAGTGADGQTPGQVSSYKTVNTGLNTVNTDMHSKGADSLRPGMSESEKQAFLTMEQEPWGSDAWKAAFRQYMGMEKEVSHAL